LSPVTATRRRLIRKLIGERPITSQAMLVELLEAEGHSVTQATVSRDLDAIGASKVRDDAGMDYYAVVRDAKPMSDAELRLVKSINEFVVEIAVSGDIVVLHTPPGAADLVAGAIDAVSIEGVIGTVAGDDTLMVVAAPVPGGARIADKIEQMGAGR
jgi:transcriptional regulator of arginine metabolism